MKRLWQRATALAVTGVLAAVGLVVAVPVAASAHTPTASATCEALSVSASYYETKPGTPDTTKQELVKDAWIETVPAVTRTVDHPAITEIQSTYTRYSWTGGKDSDPGSETPPSSNWNPDNKKYDGSPVGQAIQQGGGHGSWFYWTKTDVTVTVKDAWTETIVVTPEQKINHPAEYQTVTVPGTPADNAPNTVVVAINGQQVVFETFGTDYSKTIPFADKTTANTWTVTITAWNDPDGSEGWTKTISGTTTPCVPPVTGVICTATGSWYSEDGGNVTFSPEGAVFTATGSKPGIDYRVQTSGNLQGWTSASYVASGGTSELYFRMTIASPSDGFGYKSLSFPGYTTIDQNSVAYQTGKSIADMAEQWPNAVITSVGFSMNSGAVAGTTATLKSFSSDCGDVNFGTTKPKDDVVTVIGKPVITCDNKVGDVVEYTNSTTTTPYVWDGSKFVLGEPTTVIETVEYTATQADIDALDCAVIVPPTEEPPVVTPPVKETPKTPAPVSGTLATTGMDAGLIWGAGIATVLLIGVGLYLLVGRRKKDDAEAESVETD